MVYKRGKKYKKYTKKKKSLSIGLGTHFEFVFSTISRVILKKV